MKTYFGYDAGNKPASPALFYLDIAPGAVDLSVLATMPEELNRAFILAINKSLTEVKTASARLLKEEYNVKYGDVLRAYTVSRAKAGKMFGTLLARGRVGIPLIDYISREPKFHSDPGGGGATVTRWVGRKGSKQARPAIGTKVKVRADKVSTFPGAFIARMPRGKVGVYRRSGKKNTHGEAFREMYGPSIVTLLSSNRINVELNNLISPIIDKNLAHEADFVLQKMGLK